MKYVKSILVGLVFLSVINVAQSMNDDDIIFIPEDQDSEDSGVEILDQKVEELVLQSSDSKNKVYVMPAKRKSLVAQQFLARPIKRAKTGRKYAVPFQQLHILKFPDEIVLAIFEQLIPNLVADSLREDSISFENCKTFHYTVFALRLTCQKFNGLVSDIIQKAKLKNLPYYNQQAIYIIKRKDFNSAQKLTLLKYFLKAGANLTKEYRSDRSAYSYQYYCLLHEDEYGDLREDLMLPISDLNEQDRNGNTLLHHAIRKVSHKLVLSLIQQYQVMVNIPNKQDNTPLIIATKYYTKNVNHNSARASLLFDIIKLLLEYGADCNIQGQDQATALMRITIDWDIALLKLFKKYKVDPNKKNKYGQTALIQLTRNQDKKRGGQKRLTKYKALAQKLIHMGARTDIPDMHGDTVYHYASKSEKEILDEIISSID